MAAGTDVANPHLPVTRVPPSPPPIPPQKHPHATRPPTLHFLRFVRYSDALRCQSELARECQRKTAAQRAGKNWRWGRPSKKVPERAWSRVSAENSYKTSREKLTIATPSKPSTRTRFVEIVSGKQLQNALKQIGDNDALQNKYHNGLGRTCQ